MGDAETFEDFEIDTLREDILKIIQRVREMGPDAWYNAAESELEAARVSLKNCRDSHT